MQHSEKGEGKRGRFVGI